MKFGLNAHLFHAWWGVGPIGATRPCWLTVGVARWPLSSSLSGVIVQNGASAKSQDAGWNFGATYEGQNHSVHPRQEDSVVSETQTTIMYSDQQNHPWGLTPHLTPHQSSHLNVNTLRMQIISSLLLSSGPRSCNHIPATELAFCVEGRDLIAEITLWAYLLIFYSSTMINGLVVKNTTVVLSNFHLVNLRLVN